MKKVIITLVALAFLTTAIVPMTFAADPKEAFTLDSLGDSKPPVPFKHKKHSDKDGGAIECKECHHTLASNEETPKACGECHKPREENDLGELGKAPAALYNEKGTKNIFHDNCKGCHKDKKKGPTKCKECHVK
jgi:hypothetical protein